MPTEYANAAACRAAGVEPVPQVEDIVCWPDVVPNPTRVSEITPWGDPVVPWPAPPPDWPDDEPYDPDKWAEAEMASDLVLVRRSDVTIPQHSDTPEGV